MADIPQVLATYDALVGVALGAGLTYGLGALNRRHQEAREDRTRWYEARLQTYARLYEAAYNSYFSIYRPTVSSEGNLDEAFRETMNAVGAIHFIGSQEVIKAAETLVDKVLEGGKGKPSGDFLDDLMDALDEFQVASRKDLGHPSP